MKTYKYDSTDDLSAIEPVDDYGDWNQETRRWANGKTHKPIEMANKSKSQFDYWDIEPDVDYSQSVDVTGDNFHSDWNLCF